MKKIIICLLLLMSFSSFAEMKLESSELVYYQPTTSKRLQGGRVLLSGPAVLKLIEVDDENGSIRQTTINLEFNQLIKNKKGFVVSRQPVQASGPWLLIGLGEGETTLKITGLRGHSLKDLLDKPFTGTATSIGFIYGVVKYDVKNGAGIQLLKGATVATGLGKEEVKLTISSRNANVEVNQSGKVSKLSLDSILDAELK